ncbi:uncharacterized protein LOC101458545 [Ceratitis capitata]|uniref:uncharacterized protein LOC101458545 n=1 Tax=Ceratitis capitata TaxID=7213 RepID=UPI000329B24D|nr:uncharacterized protein LOC101458545 [Ceratitis capitata]
MKMLSKLLTLCIVLAVAPLIPVDAADQCGECMESNFVQCINETSYIICYEETATMAPIDEEVYNCPANQFCTNSVNVCESNPDGENIISVCSSGTNSACSSCTGKANGALICLSSTQFAICRSNVASNPLSCNAGQLCSEELVSKQGLKKVCAPQSVLDYFELTSCNIEETVTPQPTSPATPSTTVNPLTECENAGLSSAYFQIPYPDFCKSYIYCERNGSTYISLVMNCKSGQFYSEAQKTCITATSCPQ